MKVISLNIRSFGVVGRFGWVKNLCFTERPDIFALQETKCKHLDDNWVHSLWGSNDCAYIQKEVVGNSGGLLLIWDTNTFSVSGAVGNDLFIAIRGQWKRSGEESIIVNVYGPHNDADKKLMWHSLDSLLKSVDSSWLLCGDFNEVRVEAGRLNCDFHKWRATWFNDFINRNNLIDIPLCGRRFTRISDDGMKFCKIDRFLISDNFLKLWDDLSVIPLERKESDHCPLILRDKLVDFGLKPFKVFNEWFKKEW
ncbi:uncharacterized protein [Rutidosis leptorrhynchoides]|uniref:uncharacterized protein n=1 Tax=Rutidosis leptorrhynchoides TaxID=125765 RepID=UPI003A9A651B